MAGNLIVALHVEPMSRAPVSSNTGVKVNG